MKRHVETGATNKMTFEPWSALSHDVAQQECARNTNEGQTNWILQCSAPKVRTKHRNNAVPQPHARNTPVSLTDHSFCLTAVHMTPFSTSVFPAASPVYQQCSRIRSCGSNIAKDNNTRRNIRKRARANTTVPPPTDRSHQGQILKSEYIPWDENVVSSHCIDAVQLTDCVTDEFRFQQIFISLISLKS